MMPDYQPDPFTEEDCIPWDPDGWDTSSDEELGEVHDWVEE